jgi:hypothetical protein
MSQAPVAQAKVYPLAGFILREKDYECIIVWVARLLKQQSRKDYAGECSLGKMLGTRDERNVT